MVDVKIHIALRKCSMSAQVGDETCSTAEPETLIYRNGHGETTFFIMQEMETWGKCVNIKKIRGNQSFILEGFFKKEIEIQLAKKIRH